VRLRRLNLSNAQGIARSIFTSSVLNPVSSAEFYFALDEVTNSAQFIGGQSLKVDPPLRRTMPNNCGFAA
jgi:hypothetical protein